MDAAASVLGTPVATVDAPDTAMIPLNDPGTDMSVSTAPPSGAEPIATPGTAMMQPQEPPQPGQIGTTQSTLPDAAIATAAVHHNWLSKIIDTVGSILGGNQTLTMTKHPDGTMTVEHNPSTTGEKWERIASAALGGAARGMAVGQGPGGAGRAFAAGTMAGMATPQQTLDAANKQAANMNAQQLAAANQALIQQKSVQQMLDNRAAGLTLGQEESSILQSTADAIGNSTNTKDLGTFTDMQGIMRALNSNPDAMSGHTNQALKVIPTADAQGHVQLHAYLTDVAEDRRKNDKVERDLYVDVDPTTGAPTLKSRDINPQSQPLVQIRQAQQANIAKYFDMKDKWDKSHRPEKTDTNPLALQLDINRETDPVKRQQMQAALDADQKRRVQIAQESRPVAPGATAASLGGASGPEALSALPSGDAATVRAIGEGRQAAPSRFTKEGQRIMGMVNQVYPDYDSTQFPTYQKMRTYMTSGAGGVGLNFIGTARNHLTELENNIPDNVTIPLIGSAINWAKNAATRSTSPALRAFESARSAVSDEVAKAYKGGALSQAEHDQMMGLINESDSPGALRGSIGEFRRLLNGKLASYQTQWNSGMPRGAVSPNSTIESLLAETPAAPTPAAAAAPATPATPAPAPVKTIPTGKVPAYLNGQVVGYADDKKGTNYHAF